MKKSGRIMLSTIAGAMLLSLVAAIQINAKSHEEIKADAASSYYDGFDWNSSGSALRKKLTTLISKNTVNVGYDGLWDVYKTADVRSDGKLWDTYSNTTNFVIGGSAQGASYKGEGDGYNREHVIPQSIFNEGAPMKSDAHHVLPTDGYVNNRRGTYPHGEVGTATYSSNNGFTKVGTSKTSGINGTVCEVADQYKGDYARIYFYFATRYANTWGSSWGSYAPFNYSSDLCFSSNYLSLYLKWAKQDPVSQKEIDRNNAVFAKQKNRNPFVDFPYAVGAIWDPTNAEDYGPLPEEGITIDPVDPGDPDDPTPVDPDPSTPVTEDFSIVPTHFPTAYDSSATSRTIDGIDLNLYNVATYDKGSTIQMRKDGSTMYNESAFTNIDKLVLDMNTGSVEVYAGESENPSTLIEPEEDGSYNLNGADYFKIVNSSSGVAKINKIDIYLQEAGSEDVHVESVTLNKDTLALDLGASYTLTATVLPANAGNKTVTWSSSNENIATVNNGVITTKAEGSVTITATAQDGGESDSCLVTITDRSLVSLSLSGTAPNAVFGEEYEVSGITATAHYKDGSSKSVTPSFSIVNTKVLGNQEVTAVYQEGGKSAQATFNVKVTNNGSSLGTAGVSDSLTLNTAGTGYDRGGDLIKSYSLGGYTTAENSSMRYGSGKQNGSLTITLNEETEIASISINGRKYSNDSSSFNIVAGSENKSLTCPSSDGDVTWDLTTTATTDTITISAQSGKRFYINSVTIESAGDSSFTAQEQASAYSAYFLQTTQGNCHDASIWNEVKNEYTYMPNESKTEFLKEFKIGGQFEAAYLRYKFAIDNYPTLNDFLLLGRSTSNIHGIIIDKNVNALALILVGTIAISTALVLVTKNKRRTH